MSPNKQEPEKKRLKTLEKQKLHDIEHKISADVGNFLVLLEEGSEEAIQHARTKARADLLKWGNDLEQIAQTLGGNYREAVETYLTNVDTVLHTSIDFIDDEKVRACFDATRKLEQMLK